MLDFIVMIVEVNDAKLGGMRGNKQENISFLALHLEKGLFSSCLQATRNY